MGLLIDPHNVKAKLASGELRAMRQSTIGQYETCAMRVMHDRLQPPAYRSGDARCCGTAYHAGLEYYWLCRQAGEVFNIDVMKQVIYDAAMNDLTRADGAFAWDKFANLDDIAAKAQYMAVENVTRYVHHWAPGQWQVLGIEAQFMMPWFGDWAATGTIDLVLSNGMKTVLLDHKSAGRMWPITKHLKSPQPGWYGHWWAEAAKAFNVDPGVMLMCFEIMTYQGKFDRRWVVPTPKTNSSAITKAELVIRSIESDGPWFPNTGSNLCSAKYCDHFTICDFGANLTTLQMEAERLADIPDIAHE